MRKITKISFWILAIGTAALVAAYYLTPRLINSDLLKDRIENAVSKGIDGEVKFSRVDLSIFPRPSATIHDGTVNTDLASGSVTSLSVYPKLLPLLIGKFQATKVLVDTPAITVNMTSQVSRDTDKKPAPTLSVLVDSLTSYVPNLDVVIKNGSLDLNRGDENAYLMKGFDLHINFLSPGQKRLQAYLESSGLQLNLQREGKELSVNASGLKAGINYDDDKWSVSLQKVDIDYPGLKLAGKLSVDTGAGRVNLSIEAKEMDVQSTRDTALLLARDTPATQKIFRIVKGGHIPLITFKSTGDSFGALDDTENFVIRGGMENGEIFIPGVSLELKEVGGNVVISKGILEVENLEADLGNSHGNKGRLEIGLKGEDPPFHLDIMVQTDLAQLHPLLKRLVNNKEFVDELSLIDNPKGSAYGRLILGDSLKSIKARVEATDLDLTANYKRIPYPLTIKSKQFYYDENETNVERMSGIVGKSSFSELTANIGLGKDPYLEIKSAKSHIILDEIYSWLLSYEKLRNALKHLKSAEGRFELSELNLKGPLLNPEDWHFTAKGGLKSLVFDTSLSHGPVTLKQGKLEADDIMLNVTDAEINLLDALFQVSGKLKYYSEGLMSDLMLSGQIGPEAAKWLSEFINLPSVLRIRAPLFVSQAHLVLEEDNKASFRGNFSLQRRVEVFLDLFRGPDKFSINNLHIQDNESDAALEFNLGKKAFDFKFAGDLTGPTLDKIFTREIVVSRWIRGDFETHFSIDQPVRSSFEGKLEAKDVIFPLKLKEPVNIKSISLDADKSNIKVISADIDFGETSFNLKGNINASKEGFLFFAAEEKDKDTEQFYDFPIKGIIRLNSDSFTYGKYTWEPLKASIAVSPDNIDVAVTESSLCNVSFPGNIKFTPQELSLAFQPISDDKDLKSAIDCLWGTSGHVTGRYNLSSKFIGAGKGGEIKESLTGNLTISAKEGRIYKGGLLAKVFAFLNFTEIFRGQLPDLVNEGFAYKSIEATSGIKGSTLNIEKVIIDGSSMNIVSKGNVDLVSEQVDLEMLVAPLKTADFILGKIPLIKDLTGGTFVSIPLRVTGNIDNPKILYIPASAVGSGLINIMKGTLEAPFKVIEPITGK
jgi:hypothetical protein